MGKKKLKAVLALFISVGGPSRKGKLDRLLQRGAWGRGEY